MSTSDVFTAVSSLVALGVAVAGATLFIIRTVKKKKNLSGRDIGVIGIFVILALFGAMGASILIPKVLPPKPSAPLAGANSIMNNNSNSGQTNNGNNNLNVMHSNIYIEVGQNLPAASTTPNTSPVSTNEVTQNPYAQDMQTSQINSTLNSNSSTGVQWEESNITENGGRYICAFYQGYYHAYESGGTGLTTCMAQQTNFSDFTYEIQMDIVQGNYGGILFRAQNSQLMYMFLVNTSGTCGLYALENSSAGSSFRGLVGGTITQFYAGFNRTNTIAVVTHGTQIDIYVNKVGIIRTFDNSYSLGSIGVVAGGNSDVVYGNAHVWTV